MPKRNYFFFIINNKIAYLSLFTLFTYHPLIDLFIYLLIIYSLFFFTCNAIISASGFMLTFLRLHSAILL